VIEDASDVVLFAGGTGITAFTAFLDGLTPEFGHRVYLAYGARTAALLLYREMLERRAADVSCFQRRYFVEQPDAESERIGAAVGRLSVDAVWPHIPAPGQATYYLSGPPIMLKTLAGDLRGRDIADAAIRMDAWE